MEGITVPTAFVKAVYEDDVDVSGGGIDWNAVDHFKYEEGVLLPCDSNNNVIEGLTIDVGAYEESISLVLLKDEKRSLLNQLRALCKDHWKEVFMALLEEPGGLPLESRTTYLRLQDDCDGDFSKGHLFVTFSPDGDAWVGTDLPYQTLRFRTFVGGGRSIRTWNALRFLAFAMMLDEKERPDPVTKPVPSDDSPKKEEGESIPSPPRPVCTCPQAHSWPGPPNRRQEHWNRLVNPDCPVHGSSATKKK